jgi:tol-pal system protein YbgF
MRKIFVLSLISFCTLLHAAPVVDANDSSSQTALVQSQTSTAANVDTSSMSVAERLERLEQMVSAQGQIQLNQRLEQLQQQIEILQGQNEVLHHELQQVQTRQYTLFQKLSSGKKVTMPDTSMPQSSNEPKDQAAYQAAYAKITAGDYGGAISALQSFVQQFPQSTNVPNALYWQGEVFTAQGKNAPAQKVLHQLILQFPSSPRIADAQLKLANIAIDNDNNAQAETLLKNIIKQYPGSSAASVAKNKIRLINGG